MNTRWSRLVRVLTLWCGGAAVFGATLWIGMNIHPLAPTLGLLGIYIYASARYILTGGA